MGEKWDKLFLLLNPAEWRGILLLIQLNAPIDDN